MSGKEAYLQLSKEEKIAYLRTHGYFYDVTHTKIDIDAMLGQYEATIRAEGFSGNIPNFTPVRTNLVEGHKEFIASYNLFIYPETFNKYNPRSVDDLKSTLIMHHDREVNFYDCFVANIISASVFLRENNYNGRVRVYLADNLSFLFDVLRENNIEVFVIRELENTSNKEAAYHWRLLAFGEESADYTICIDSDEPLTQYQIDIARKVLSEEVDYFTPVAANTWNNSIDGGNRFGFSYIHGGYNVIKNSSGFFRKYKISDLLRAYYTLSEKTGYGEITLYPVIARDPEYAVQLETHHTNWRCLTGYGGDQCFLNSILFFWFAEHGRFALFQHKNAEVIPGDYHLFYSYPFLIYLNEHGNRIIDALGVETTADFMMKS